MSVPSHLRPRPRATTGAAMTAPTCTCPCRGCIAFHVRPGAAPHLAINEEELALALTLAVSDALRSRGIDPAEPGAGEAKAVELVLTRVTALARQLGELIDDPQDGELVERARLSVDLLAANLVAVVGERQRLS